MLPRDIPQAMALKRAENWNQTEADWHFLLKQHPDLCWLATADEKVVGTVTAVNYRDQLSWIGMMLVSKEYRGRGLSSQLLARILGKLALCPVVKLDATAAGRSVYTRHGFKDEATIYRMIRQAQRAVPPRKKVSPAEIMMEKDFDKVVACDQEAYGASRADLLHYLKDSSSFPMWLIRHGQQVTGYAFSRVGSQYHQIGPLGASRTEDARILVASALKDLSTVPLVVDVLASQPELIKWLEDSGFSIQRQFARMYYRENATLGNSKNQFLIAGPEFG